MTEKMIVEVGGVKMEVDTRYARRIEEISIGSKVKVLTKTYSGHKVSPGVVIGFEPFQKLPTIIIAMIEQDYAKAEVKIVHYNADTEDVEVVIAVDEDLSVDKASVLTMFDRQVRELQLKIDAINEQRTYFETNFRAYWEKVVPALEPEVAAKAGYDTPTEF